MHRGGIERPVRGSSEPPVGIDGRISGEHACPVRDQVSFVRRDRGHAEVTYQGLLDTSAWILHLEGYATAIAVDDGMKEEIIRVGSPADFPSELQTRRPELAGETRAAKTVGPSYMTRVVITAKILPPPSTRRQ